MRPFAYEKPGSLGDVTAALARQDAAPIAGGTTLLDLMKLDVLTPGRLVDITGLEALRCVELDGNVLKLGALTRMSEAADHPLVRERVPVVAEALALAASGQLRNMATLAGNILQRTRCPYFRDASAPCNRREPGTGCGALDGWSRMHAVLGTSDKCIASYPGDFAVALVALDAEVEIVSAGGHRIRKVEGLHRLPDGNPERETVLEPDDLITMIRIPLDPVCHGSTYHKVRDRQSYAFANASAAVALEMLDSRVRDVRIALGGVGTVPWRAHAAEDSLKGRPLDEGAALRAAELAMRGARTTPDNAFKVPLGAATVAEALMTARGRAAA
jgi:xanthine dehydrogenase YagS FAD-binding subunit